MIIYRVNNYRRAVMPALQRMTKQEHVTPLEQISRIVQVTDAPILVVAALYREVYGTSEALETFITRLQRFYQAELEEGEKPNDQRSETQGPTEVPSPVGIQEGRPDTGEAPSPGEGL